MDEEECIEFAAYRMPKGRMLSVLAWRHMRWAGAVAILAAAALLTVGIIVDLRLAACALLLLLVVYPLIVMAVYIRYSLTPDVAVNVVEHTSSLHSDGIRVRWRPSLTTSELEECRRDDREPEELPWRTDVIPFSRITDISIGLKALTVWLSDAGAGSGFIYLPYDTIPEGKADKVLDVLQRNRPSASAIQPE